MQDAWLLLSVNYSKIILVLIKKEAASATSYCIGEFSLFLEVLYLYFAFNENFSPRGKFFPGQPLLPVDQSEVK